MLDISSSMSTLNSHIEGEAEAIPGLPPLRTVAALGAQDARPPTLHGIGATYGRRAGAGP